MSGDEPPEALQDMVPEEMRHQAQQRERQGVAAGRDANVSGRDMTIDQRHVQGDLHQSPTVTGTGTANVISGTVNGPAVQARTIGEIHFHGDGKPEEPAKSLDVHAWNVPASNPDFTGRESQLAAIRRDLLAGTPAAVQALQGMGGVGKTQLAIEYANRYADEYDVKWWINSENPVQLAEQYRELAVKLGIAVRDTPQDEMRSAVRGALHRHPSWLLIFDNAEDPKVLRDWLPGGPGHVLITSRRQDWHGLASLAEVDLLARPESIQLLRKHVPALTDHDADALAEALGDLPLALVQAGAFLADSPMPAAEYVSLIETRAADLLHDGEPHDYPRPLTAATTLAYDRLRAADGDAATLAAICAHLAPEPVSVDWLVKAAEALPDSLATRLTDAVNRRGLLAALTRTALVRLDDEGLMMHRLIQAILRESLSPPGEYRAWAETIVTANGSEDTDRPDTWPAWARLLPHVLALTPERATTPALRETAVCAARYLFRAGNARDALTFADRLHHHWHDYPGSDDEQMLHIATVLAEAHAALGNFDRARRVTENILVRRRRLNGDGDPRTLVVANNLANHYRALGNFQKARVLHEEAFKCFNNAIGPDHPETLRA